MASSGKLKSIVQRFIPGKKFDVAAEQKRGQYFDDVRKAVKSLRGIEQPFESSLKGKTPDEYNTARAKFNQNPRVSALRDKVTAYTNRVKIERAK